MEKGLRAGELPQWVGLSKPGQRYCRAETGQGQGEGQGNLLELTAKEKEALDSKRKMGQGESTSGNTNAVGEWVLALPRAQ